MTLARHEQPPQGVPAALASNIAAQVPVLVTDTLTLRAPKVEDFEAYHAILCSDRGQYIYPDCSREDAWHDFVQLASGWVLHGHGGWAIEDNESGALCGFVLLGLEPGDQEIELGYMLLEEHEGLGIAHEACLMARYFAFDTLKLSRLVSYVNMENTRSIALADRLGATRTEHDDTMLAFFHTPELPQ